jgi:hypothetical protein
VINLEIFGTSGTMAAVAERLDELEDTSRVRLVDAMMVVGAVGTLALQSLLMRRAIARRRSERG